MGPGGCSGSLCATKLWPKISVIQTVEFRAPCANFSARRVAGGSLRSTPATPAVQVSPQRRDRLGAGFSRNQTLAENLCVCRVSVVQVASLFTSGFSFHHRDATDLARPLAATKRLSMGVPTPTPSPTPTPLRVE